MTPLHFSANIANARDRAPGLRLAPPGAVPIDVAPGGVDLAPKRLALLGREPAATLRRGRGSRLGPLGFTQGGRRLSRTFALLEHPSLQTKALPFLSRGTADARHQDQ